MFRPPELVNPLLDASLDAQILFFSRTAAAIGKALGDSSQVRLLDLCQAPRPLSGGASDAAGICSKVRLAFATGD
jgi:hypothetical protein